jgi:hypothetical protein
MPRVCTRCCKAIALRTWSNDAITLLIAEKPHERWGTTPQEPAPLNQRAESLATVKSDSSTEIRTPESWQSACVSRHVVRSGLLVFAVLLLSLPVYRILTLPRT